jgi:hypothetical protein
VKLVQVSRYAGHAGEVGVEIRYMHEQLFICVAFELWLCTQPFLPCFLHDLGAAARVTFVQRVDCAKVNLRVYVILERWRQVVGMIVRGALTVVVPVVIVLVVAMRHLPTLGLIVMC